MSLIPYLFCIIAAITGLSAIMVVVTQNIVRAAAWLLFTLAGTAGVFFLLGSDFIGAAQLIVYVGGTMVLVVFGVMLTAQGPFVNLKTGAGEWALSLVVGVALYATLGVSALTAKWPHLEGPAIAPNPQASTNTALLGQALTGVKEVQPAGDVPGVAGRPRKQVAYLLPFEIVSVHLLVVLIAAAYLARAKRKRDQLGAA
jgi:NADH-quinone oxidoreductase subunit J